MSAIEQALNAMLPLSQTTKHIDLVGAAFAELASIRADLRSIVSTYERRSELFINDADCAGNLCDRARRAISQVKKE